MSRNKNRRPVPAAGAQNEVVDTVDTEVVDGVEEVEAEATEEAETAVAETVDTSNLTEEELAQENNDSPELAEPAAPAAQPVFEDEPQEDPNAIVVPEAEEVPQETTPEFYEVVEAQEDHVVETPRADAKVLAAAQGDQDAAYIATELEAYSQAMALGRYIDERTGAGWQLKLLRILQKVFNNVSAESFTPSMSVVNTWFYENRDGLTSDGAMFRFAPNWPGSHEDHQSFTRFCSLLKLTCDPKSRAAAIKDTNFEYWLEFGLTEAGRDRLLAYFGK